MTRNLCRLCANSSSDHKSLYEPSGRPSEDYEITERYFPAKYLELRPGTDEAVVCIDCWHHVFAFYNFQLSVTNIQNCLSQTEKMLAAYGEEAVDVPDGGDRSSNEIAKSHLKVIEKMTASGTTLQLMDVDVPQATQEYASNCPADSSNGEARNIKQHGDFNISLSDLEDIEFEFSSDNDSSEGKEGAIQESSTEGKRSSPSFQKPVPLYRTILKDFIALYISNISCPICKCSLTHFEDLTPHFYKNHSNDVPYIVCCGIHLNTLFRIRKHIRKCHVHYDVFKCQKCGHNCPDAESLVEHYERQHSVEVDNCLKCPLCDKLLTTVDSFKSHYDNHFSCRNCGEAFKTTGDLKRHLQIVHFYQEPLTCEQCGKTMATKARFINHTTFAHKSLWSFRCEICEKGFSDFFEFRGHINTHSQRNYYNCPLCRKKIKFWSLLKAHVRTKHTDHSTTEVVHNLMITEQKYIVTYTDDEGVEHATSWLGNATKANDMLVKTTESAKASAYSDNSFYTCPICWKKFVHLSHVNAHVKQTHKGEETEDVMNRVISTKGNSVLPTADVTNIAVETPTPIAATELTPTDSKLVDNVCIVGAMENTATGTIADESIIKSYMIRGFTCDHCKAFFRTSVKLMNHKIKVHPTTIDKMWPQQYQCDICKKLFKQTLYFQNHIKSCLLNSCSCPICGKKFLHLANMNSHVIKTHKIEPLKDVSRQAITIEESCGSSTRDAKKEPSAKEHNAETKTHPTGIPLVDEITTSAVETDTMAAETFGANEKSLQTINMIRVFTCEQCEELFSVPWKLKQHNKRVHSKTTNKTVRQYQCEICKRLFNETTDFQKHANSCLDNSCYSCPICSKRFLHSAHLKSHVTQTHTDEQPDEAMHRVMAMKGCGAVTQEDVKNETTAIVPTERDGAVEAVSTEAATKITATAEIHSTIETTVPAVSTVKVKNTTAFICKKCDNSFYNRMKYNQHKKMAHATLQYKCELCDHIFEKLSYFQSHTKCYPNSKYYTCPLCWQKFLNLAHVKFHIAQTHKEQDTEDVMCRLITTKGCCVSLPTDDTNAAVETFNENPTIKLDGSMEAETIDSKTHKSCGKKKKPKMFGTFTCKFCDSSFTELAIFREHKKLAHSILQYMCQLCKKLFDNLTDFQKHIKAYADTEYYTCPHCWKKFLHLADVKSHMKQTHLVQKPEYVMQEVIVTKGCCVLPSTETVDTVAEIALLESDRAIPSGAIDATIGEFECVLNSTKEEI